MDECPEDWRRETIVPKDVGGGGVVSVEEVRVRVKGTSLLCT